MKPVTVTKHPSPSLVSRLRGLAADCAAADGLTLSCPDDGDVFFFLSGDLAHEETPLRAALVLYAMEEGLWECSAFTRPELRREGRFSALLAAAEDYAPDGRFCFAADGNCPAALAVLDSIGAGFWYREHAMELTRSGLALPLCPDPPLRLAFQDGGTAISVRGLDVSRTAASCMLSLSLPGPPLLGDGGLPRIAPGSSCCIHQVLVPEKLRGQGMGTRFLQSLLPVLFDCGAGRILLQVSGDNPPALALYKKAGFRITETLSYYLY